jgi:ABC-type transport system involved in cytochrome c biogenesis ATPase subunit
MILQFSFSNFRTFRAQQTLNLAASNYDKSLPENCIEPQLPGLTGKLRRWTKGVAIYGANASGKSTVLQALSALASIVLSSGKVADPTEPIALIDPFALDPAAAQEPTAFAIVFVQAGVRYEYRVAATRQRIWHESLRTYPTAREQLWFTRDWSDKDQNFVYGPAGSSDFVRDPILENRTLPNALHLSKLVAENNRQVEPVFRWFKERLVFLDLSPRSQLIEAFSNHQIAAKSPLAARIFGVLQHADIGVTGAVVREGTPTPGELQQLLTMLPAEKREELKHAKVLQTQLVHRAPGGTALPLRWETESAGTHRLFALAGPWFDILQAGRVVCIDELETSMHPLMVRELLRLLFSSQENTRQAQILFTTHNPLLLDPTLIRRDQVWFADKDNEGMAHLYPLTDYEPRQGESLVRGYMAGRYGAVPFIPAGLLGGFSEASPPPAEVEAVRE